MEKMNDRIQFIYNDIEINENGFSSEVEKVLYECWCNSKLVSFKEFYSNYTTNNKKVYSFKCRYCNALKNIDSLTNKIKYQGKLYNIIYIVNDNNKYFLFKGEAINE